MNRYPIWKYLIILFALVISILYTIPNFFGESPAIQVSPGKATVKVTDATMAKVEDALRSAGIKPQAVHLDAGSQQSSASVRVRFGVTDSELQLQGREVLERALNPDPTNPDYVIALNLVPNTPEWLSAIGGKPMYLGLDLRGGVHFRLEVDMKAAIQKRIDSNAADIRTQLRDKDIRNNGVDRSGDTIVMQFPDENSRDKAFDLIRGTDPDLALEDRQDGGNYQIVARMTDKAIRDVQDYAIKQNISTLHNRINELGVAEPVIAQQGATGIVVELPGVQDTAKAKDILGRTATLEIRMVDDTPEAYTQMASGTVPFGDEVFTDRENHQVLVRRRVLLTGEISDELFGYKYTDYAPTADAFQQESQKRIRELYMYDVLRADRCISANSIEARVPFGDLDFVRYVMAIDPEKKLNSYGKGKYLLRKAFEGDWLPPEILWREKAAFSDAVGHSMVDDIKEYAESLYTDEEFQLRRANYSAHCMPFTKESLFYREIFEKYYHDQSRTIVDFWMPNKAWPGCNVNDPSARVLANYGASGV